MECCFFTPSYRNDLERLLILRQSVKRFVKESLSHYVIVPKEDFIKLLNSNREVSVKFLKMLAGNVVSQQELLLQLAYNSVRKRVANVLLLLHDHYGDDPISILRYDIAALAGTAKESVIRTLTDFREEKLISADEGRIVVLNLDKLKVIT